MPITKHHFRHIFPALILCLGAACTTSSDPLKTGFSVALTKDDTHNIPSALEATANQFFRVPALPPAPAAAARAPVLPAAAGGFVVDMGSDTPHSVQSSARVRLRAGLEQPLSDHVSLVGGASVSRGQSRYLLPEGIGILVDPMTIRFVTTGLELDAGVAVYAGNRIETRLAAGVGGTLTHTRTQITSALIDVRNASYDKAGFVYVSGQLGLLPANPGWPKLRLGSRARFFPGTGVSVQTELALDF